MRAIFWGTRGSISTPGPDKVRYGANTSCVSLQSGDHRLILDAGFGIVLLADRIMAWRRPKEQLSLPLFLSHLHWDHVIGLPFFTPIFFQKVELDIWGRSAKEVRDGAERLFTSTYSPINGIQNLGATLRYHSMDGDPVSVGPFRVTHAQTRHPSATLAYRIEAEGKSFVYVSDHEAGDPAVDQGIRELAEGADVLVHDAQWTEEEAARFTGYGHSSWAQAVEAAREASARTLVLFHHHHRHDDDTLDEMGRLARDAAPASLEVIVARDGLLLQP
jgi:phosphoribosyl 1,2-cyclic phosphodiesterase